MKHGGKQQKAFVRRIDIAPDPFYCTETKKTEKPMRQKNEIESRVPSLFAVTVELMDDAAVVADPAVPSLLATAEYDNSVALSGSAITDSM